MFASQINVGQTSVQICLDINLASVSGIGMMGNSSPCHSHKCPGFDNELCASLDACNLGGYLSVFNSNNNQLQRGELLTRNATSGLQVGHKIFV